MKVCCDAVWLPLETKKQKIPYQGFCRYSGSGYLICVAAISELSVTTEEEKVAVTSVAKRNNIREWFLRIWIKINYKQRCWLFPMFFF